jgi:hypothetical protein
MIVVDKLLIILNGPHREDGLLWKQIGDEE